MPAATTNGPRLSSPVRRAPRFMADQARAQEHADVRHFEWQTQGPFFGDRERALVDLLHVGDGQTLLEIGCGEGGNLFHLAQRSGGKLFGIDRSPTKAEFARQNTGAEVLTGDGAELPFADATFDFVLIRDVLHHAIDPHALLTEARRVLRARGRLLLIEPNGRSPLAMAQGLLVVQERGVLASNDGSLRALLARAGFAVLLGEELHPLPVERALLHPALGASLWGAQPWVQEALALVERVSRRLVPRAFWFYLRYLAEPMA